MASSRLEKIGTIFTRVTGLIRAGAMKMEDRPIWYDLYKAFPPTLQPKFDRAVPKTKIREIFYQEDAIRAQFHKKMGRSLPTVNLNDKKMSTVCQKLIFLCDKIQREKEASIEQAFDEAFDIIKAEILIYKKSEPDVRDPSLATTFKEAVDKQSIQTPLNVNVKDIFKDS